MYVVAHTRVDVSVIMILLVLGKLSIFGNQTICRLAWFVFSRVTQSSRISDASMKTSDWRCLNTHLKATTFVCLPTVRQARVRATQ